MDTKSSGCRYRRSLPCGVMMKELSETLREYEPCMDVKNLLPVRPVDEAAKLLPVIAFTATDTAQAQTRPASPPFAQGNRPACCAKQARRAKRNRRDLDTRTEIQHFELHKRVAHVRRSDDHAMAHHHNKVCAARKLLRDHPYQLIGARKRISNGADFIAQGRPRLRSSLSAAFIQCRICNQRRRMGVQNRLDVRSGFVNFPMHRQLYGRLMDADYSTVRLFTCTISFGVNVPLSIAPGVIQISPSNPLPTGFRRTSSSCQTNRRGL